MGKLEGEEGSSSEPDLEGGEEGALKELLRDGAMVVVYEGMLMVLCRWYAGVELGYRQVIAGLCGCEVVGKSQYMYTLYIFPAGTSRKRSTSRATVDRDVTRETIVD